MTTTGNQRVMVSVRVRPMLREGAHMQAQEKFELQSVYRTGDTSIKVELTKPGEPAKSSMFNFDYIFDQESTQLEVYEDAVVDMVDAALVGINATLLAYGQTGSGKTFTVLGDVKPNPLENDLLTNNSGMFLRVLSDLMDYKLRQFKRGWHVVVGLSCMEIYNENIRDLFGGKPGTPPPPLKAVMIGDEVILPSLIIREMTTLQAVFNEIQLAIARRTTRATESNAASSRSHCLFSIDIMQQATSAPAPSLDMLEVTRKGADDKQGARRVSNAPPQSPTKNSAQNPPELPPYEMPFQGTVYRVNGQKEPIYTSKIILADLAGSERITKSGVTGAGLTEATSINSSLSALGNVVHNLHAGSLPSYRESKLTSLLKPTFSQPASRVLLLAQCSPTQLTFDETISTLHFANKVKAMKVTTTTGAEAEKLQFDFLEAEKTYDAIAADLHIFQVEMYARSALIRRRLTQNQGMYYDAGVGQSGGKQRTTLKERRSAVEALGAMKLAQQERQDILDRLDKEKSEEASRTAQAIADARDALVNEHRVSMQETQEAIESETYLRVHHASQELNLQAAAQGNLIVEEEAADWAEIMVGYMREHHDACEKEVVATSTIFENVSREVNRQRLQATSHETPETIEDNRQYALHTWGHCTAKRFFSSCMELREDQMALLSIQRGNKELENWRDKNQDVLRKFEKEKGAS